jgi:hypothetical protein
MKKWTEGGMLAGRYADILNSYEEALDRYNRDRAENPEDYCRNCGCKSPGHSVDCCNK